MSRQCCFCGAHWPNVKVVDRGYMRKTGKILSHLGHLNALRNSMKGEIDRIAQKSPRTPCNNSGNYETYDRIDPKPTRGNDEKTRNDDTQRKACVGRHVHKGRSNVEIAFT